jgi:RNA binding exosome subunit
MKKIFIIAFLISCIFGGSAFAQNQQKTRKISEMINDSQRTNGILAGLMGAGSENSDNTELTMLSAITYPNSVRMKYLDETQKLSKARKKAVDKWLKDYNKTPDAKKFYVNEIAVEEDGVRYWIIAHETAVAGKLKSSAKKDDEIILNLRILGYYKKGKTTDYFLLAESVD